MAEEQKTGTSYGNIFKTTFLFGFVQVFRAVIAIVKNKLVAILIGPEGMGLLGIFSSTIQMIQTGAGLGINQSAVRDVAEAKGSGNHERVSRIVNVTNRVVLFTGLLGCLVTLILSHYLSVWTLGGTAYTLSYCVLAVVVALNIINEGKQALLKGVRHLRALAYASMIGTVVGLVTAIPLYYFFGKDGIVPELLIASTLALLVSQYFVNKIPVEPVALTLKETFKEAQPMIRMGVALMFVTLLQTITSFAVNAYIRSQGGLTDVGYFSAGNMIINGYFGVIITALMTDYYPRIAAVNNNNKAIQEELNKQSLVTLVISCPMFVLFMTLMPLFIKLLYTEEFLQSIEFIKFGIYFTLITIVSNQVDMILVAKYKSKIMLTISIITRAIQIILCIVLYTLWGLKGLGLSYMFLGILHMSIMTTIVYKLYKIQFTKLFIKLALIVLAFAISSSLVQSFMKGATYYIISILLLGISIVFSVNVSNRKLGLDIIAIIKNKIK